MPSPLLCHSYSLADARSPGGPSPRSSSGVNPLRINTIGGEMLIGFQIVCSSVILTSDVPPSVYPRSPIFFTPHACLSSVGFGEDHPHSSAQREILPCGKVSAPALLLLVGHAYWCFFSLLSRDPSLPGIRNFVLIAARPFSTISTEKRVARPKSLLFNI